MQTYKLLRRGNGEYIASKYSREINDIFPIAVIYVHVYMPFYQYWDPSYRDETVLFHNGNSYAPNPHRPLIHAHKEKIDRTSEK